MSLELRTGKRMRFPYYYILCFLIFDTILVKAQNPYESVGSAKEVLSLSRGRYDELPLNDTLIKIGSVVINMNSMKLESMLYFDTLRYEYSNEPGISSRWWSTDPMEDEYPSISPYVFAADNPVYFIDTDGQLLRDQDGNLIVFRTGVQKIEKSATGLYLDAAKKVPIMAVVAYEEVIVYGNDNLPIKAKLVTKVDYYRVDTNIEGKQIATPVTAEQKKQLDGVLDMKQNCHGVSCADGELTITTNEMGDEFRDEKEFKTVPKGEAELVVYTDESGNTTHSAKKNGDTYVVDDGQMKPKTTDEIGASIKGKYKNPKYKKEVQKKVAQTKGQVKGKIRFFTNEAEIKRQ